MRNHDTIVVLPPAKVVGIAGHYLLPYILHSFVSMHKLRIAYTDVIDNKK